MQICKILTRNNIRKYYGDKFYISNDDAHGIEHADEVCDLMLKMNKELSLNLDKTIIILAAYIHDIYSDDEGRAIHHQLANSYVLGIKDKILNYLSRDSKVTIANAVKEHRASYKGEFSSVLSELLSSADRGYPNFQNIYNRALKYAKGNEEQTKLHLIDKFGREGYANFPDMYKNFFKDELELLYKEIDNLKE